MLKLLLLLCFLPCIIFAQTVTVHSPNNNINFSITDDFNHPTYSVSYKNKPVIEQSILGFVFKEKSELSNELRINRSKYNLQNTTWEQPWGEDRLIKDHHNELFVACSLIKRKN